MSDSATTSLDRVPREPEVVPPGVLAFLLRALAWIVGLFALVRVPWIQEHLLIPFARLQQGAACALTGAPRDAVVVDLSCTGADVMAITLGVLLSFPLPWRRRLAGAGVGLLLLTIVNSARIGSLSWAVGHRDLFSFLHLRLFPFLLVLTATAFVLFWIRRSKQPITASFRRRPWRPLAWVVGFAVPYFALAPVLYRSGWVLEWAFLITSASAQLLTLLGAEAAIEGNLLTTAHGRWLVTQECVLTPLIPVYLGLVWALGKSRRFKLLATAAVFVVFSLLGASRLLILALPAAVVGNVHGIAVHAFYQAIVAVLVVIWAHALRREGQRPLKVAPGWALAIGFAAAAGIQWIDRGKAFTRAETFTADPQGVLTFLPAFFAGLLIALTLVLGTRSIGASAFAALALIGLVGILRQVLGAASTSGFVLHPLALRFLSIGLPVVIAWSLRRDAGSSQ